MTAAKKEVFITGMGMFSPLGKGEAALTANDRGDSWSGNEHCILHPEDHGVTGELGEKGWRASLLAVAASRAALGNRLADNNEAGRKTGIIIGTSLFNLGLFHSYLNAYGHRGSSAIPPWALHYGLPLAHASHVAVTLGLNRMCETITDPITAGISALGMGFRAIMHGEEQSLLVGGVDSPSGGILLDFLAELLTGNPCHRPLEGCAIFHLQSGEKDSVFTMPSEKVLAYVRGYTMAYTGGDPRIKETLLAGLAARSFPDSEGVDLVIETTDLPDPLPRTLTAGPVLACGLAISLMEKPLPAYREKLGSKRSLYRRGKYVDRVIVAAEGPRGECAAVAFLSGRERDETISKRKNSRYKYQAPEPRAVITGMGVTAAIGVGKEPFFRALISGESGVVHYLTPGLDKTGPSTAAPVCDLMPVSGMQRSTQLVLAAAEEALFDAGLKGNSPSAAMVEEDGAKMGVYLAETISSAQVWVETGEALRDGRIELNHNALKNALNNIRESTMVSVVKRFDCRGETVTFASGCSGGLFAIGRAARDVLGAAAGPLILAGGVDSDLFPFAFGILSRANLLTTCPDPSEAGKPFDRDRDGEVTGEGSAIFVVEHPESAAKRGVKPYAVISGFGAAGDGHHFKYNKPDGQALFDAMQEALVRARLDVSEVDLVVSHASGFKGSDAIEIRALAALFRDCNPLPPVISIKGATGQPFSAGAPLQVAAAICALRNNMIPPTAHFRNADDDDPFDHFRTAQKPEKPIRNVMITAYGYGGGKAVMVLSAHGENK
jgi:3-oxoacyl-(acyl-carrier-protein) synthase